ncbi:hypothetical protein HKD37_03G006653 [Glycine soja]
MSGLEGSLSNTKSECDMVYTLSSCSKTVNDSLHWQNTTIFTINLWTKINGRMTIRCQEVHMDYDYDNEEECGVNESHVDCSNAFNTSQVFGTRDYVLQWAQIVAYENGFVAVIMRSDIDTGSRGRSLFVLIGCERSGMYKCRNKEFVRRDTGSRKCGCPFRLRGKPEHGREGWMVKLIYGIHNHESANCLVGHPYAGRLTKDEKKIIVDMTKSLVKPKNILLTLKENNANSCTTIKQIYNARSAYRSSMRGLDTEMQHLMKLLERDQYIHWHRLKDEVVVRDLFWYHPDAIKEWQPKVTAISESKDLSSMSLATLFGKLQEHEMELQCLNQNEENDKKKRSIALKASSSIQEENEEEDSDDEEDFSFFKFIKKRRIDRRQNFNNGRKSQDDSQATRSNKWMDITEMGCVIASRYNVILVSLSRQQSMTFFLLRSQPPPDSFWHRMICVGHVFRNHFVEVYLKDHCSLPPPALLWSSNCYSQGKQWTTPYISRMHQYTSFIIHNTLQLSDKQFLDEIHYWQPFTHTGKNPKKFQIPSRCTIDELKDLIKQVAPKGIPPLRIYESQTVRRLFFRQPGRFEYSDKLIKYEINELKTNDEVLKVLVQSNYWKKYGPIEILAVFTKYVMEFEDEAQSPLND